LSEKERAICRDNKLYRKEYEKKIGVLALLGKQGSIGITVKSCDIVILADGGNTNIDMTQQRMFRCGSESHGKKFGFIIDTNYHRVYDSIVNIANSSKLHHESTMNGIEYVLETNLIEFLNNDWFSNFNITEYNTEQIAKLIYKDHVERSGIKDIVDNITISIDSFQERYLQTLNIDKADVSKIKTSKSATGIRRTITSNSNDTTSSILQNRVNNWGGAEENINTEDQIKITDKLQQIQSILSFVLPLLCLFTSNLPNLTRYSTKNLTNLWKQVKHRRPHVYKHIVQTVNKAWFKTMKIDDVVINLDDIFGMLDQSEFIQTDVANAIESLYDKFDIQKYTLDSMNNYHRSQKLYDIIMSHINSLSSARIELADIATPITFVEEMLDKLPEDIWHNPFYKWFDPAVGKGAFVIVVFERLMKGLQKKIPNEETRMKHILRNMMYFSDINGLDVQITKHILDPLNKVYGNDDEDNSKWHDKKLKIISVDNIGNATSLHMNITLDKNKLTIDDKELVTQFAKLKLKPNIERKKVLVKCSLPTLLLMTCLINSPLRCGKIQILNGLILLLALAIS
jgi:hypothetical protein